LDADWRAANYLYVGQIYLYDNPLLKKPLRLTHIKPRLLGHSGKTPGLNFIYVPLKPRAGLWARLQMTLLPPLTFWLARWWAGRSAPKGSL